MQFNLKFNDFTTFKELLDFFSSFMLSILIITG